MKTPGAQGNQYAAAAARLVEKLTRRGEQLRRASDAAAQVARTLAGKAKVATAYRPPADLQHHVRAGKALHAVVQLRLERESAAVEWDRITRLSARVRKQMTVLTAWCPDGGQKGCAVVTAYRTNNGRVLVRITGEVPYPSDDGGPADRVSQPVVWLENVDPVTDASCPHRRHHQIDAARLVTAVEGTRRKIGVAELAP